MAITIPSAFDGDASMAARYLKQYFEQRNGVPVYEGSRFERLVGGGDAANVAHYFTPADLLAVGLLNVEIPAQAIVAILERDAAKVNDLLREVPLGLDLVDATDADIGVGSPAAKLYGTLRGYSGMGKAKVSKMLARKRPRLVPIRDSRISQLLGLENEYWIPLRTLLARNDAALHRRLIGLRDEVGIGEDISAIRVWDIVCWMQASHLLADKAAANTGG